MESSAKLLSGLQYTPHTSHQAGLVLDLKRHYASSAQTKLLVAMELAGGVIGDTFSI